MADFDSLHKDVADMKEKLSYLDGLWDAYDKVRMELSACLAAEEVDRAEVKKVHDEMAEVIASLTEKLHSRGM